MKRVEKGQKWICRSEELHTFTKNKIYTGIATDMVLDDYDRKHTVTPEFVLDNFEYIGISIIQEQKEIEEGERWECIKTVRMDSSGEVAFTKGKIYTAKLDGVFVDDSGTDHGVSGDFKDENFKLFSTVTPSKNYSDMVAGFTYELSNPNKMEFKLSDREIGDKKLELVNIKPGYKESNDKLSYELDFEFVTQMAERMDANKGKYEPYNWQKEHDAQGLYKALARHFFAVMKGEYEDDGRPFGHLEAIALNAMMINYQVKNYKK
jgi:hypothetical protein